MADPDYLNPSKLPPIVPEDYKTRRDEKVGKAFDARDLKTEAWSNSAGALVSGAKIDYFKQAKNHIMRLYDTNPQFKALIDRGDNEDLRIQKLADSIDAYEARLLSEAGEMKSDAFHDLAMTGEQNANIPTPGFYLTPKQKEDIAAGRPWKLDKFQSLVEKDTPIETIEDLNNTLRLKDDMTTSVPLEVAKWLIDPERGPGMLAGPATLEGEELDKHLEEVSKLKSGVLTNVSGLMSPFVAGKRVVEGALTGAAKAQYHKQKGTSGKLIKKKEARKGAGSGQFGPPSYPEIQETVEPSAALAYPTFDMFTDPDVWAAALTGAIVHGFENPDSIYSYRQFFIDMDNKAYDMALEAVVRENGFSSSNQMLPHQLDQLVTGKMDEIMERRRMILDRDLMGWMAENPDEAQLLGDLLLDPMNVTALRPLNLAKKVGKATGLSNLAGKLKKTKAFQKTDAVVEQLVGTEGAYVDFKHTMPDAEWGPMSDELVDAQRRGHGVADMRKELEVKAHHTGIGAGDAERARVSDVLMEGGDLPDTHPAMPLMKSRERALKEVILEGEAQRLSPELRPAHRTIERKKVIDQPEKRTLEGELYTKEKSHVEEIIKGPEHLEDYGHSKILRKDIPENLQLRAERLFGSSLDVDGVNMPVNSIDDLAVAVKKGAMPEGLHKGDIEFLRKYGNKVLENRKAGHSVYEAGINKPRLKESQYLKDPMKQTEAWQRQAKRLEVPAVEVKAIDDTLKKRGLRAVVPSKKAAQTAVVMENAYKQKYGAGIEFQALDPKRAKKYMAITGKEGRNIAGKSVVLPKPIINRLDELFPPNIKQYDTMRQATTRAITDALRDNYWRPAMGFWRTSSTVASFGFTLATNIPGAVQMSTVALGLTKGLNPLHITEAVSAPFLTYVAKQRGLIHMLAGADKITEGANMFLKVPINTPTGRQTLGQLYDIAEKHGIVGIGSMRYGFEMSGKAGKEPVSLALRGAEKGIKGLTNLGLAQVARLTDDYQRFSVFLGLAKKHGVKGDALPFILRKTDELAGNYRMLSQIENKYAKELFGFYNWNKFALKWGFKGLLENPQRFTFYTKLIDYYNNKGDTEHGMPTGANAMPRWVQSQSTFRAPSSTYKSLESQLNAYDYIQSRMEHPASTFESMVLDVSQFYKGNVSMLPKALFGMATGYDLDTNQQIPDAEEWMKGTMFKMASRPIRAYGLAFRELWNQGMFEEALDVLKRARIVVKWAPKPLSPKDKLRLGNEFGGFLGEGEMFRKNYLLNPVIDSNIQGSEMDRLMRSYESSRKQRQIFRE